MITLWLLTLTGIATQAPEAPAARYLFDDREHPGLEWRGRTPPAEVPGTAPAAGRLGAGLHFDGSSAMDLPAALAERLTGPFGFMFWIRFDAVSDNTGILVAPERFFLRLDPPAEDGTLSWFVYAGGDPAPRARGPRPEPDRWYHVAVSWDGSHASLWVDGVRTVTSRTGALPSAAGPVRFGAPFPFAPSGLRGTLDELSVYDRKLHDSDVLDACFGLAPDREGETVDLRGRDRFIAGQAPDLWLDCGLVGDRRTTGDGIAFTTVDSTSGLMIRGLRLPVDDRGTVVLRMQTSAGALGSLVFRTTHGSARLSFPLAPHGRLQTYVLDTTAFPEWGGELLSMAIIPADRPCAAEIHSVSIPAHPPARLELRNGWLEPVIARAARDCTVVAQIHNPGHDLNDVALELRLEAGIDLVGLSGPVPDRIRNQEIVRVQWLVRAAEATTADALVRWTASDGQEGVLGPIPLRFREAVERRTVTAVPAPQPAATDLLVGAMACPLWRQDGSSPGWAPIRAFPAREPALGWYDEGDPEVTDWEIKWALEHGISYFVYCWYRAAGNEGRPVEQCLDHGIHQGFFGSRFADRFRFAILWENSNAVSAGVASEEDLLVNLLPYWIETYFSRDDYLKIGGAPVLFVYDPAKFAREVGGEAVARRAVLRMREVCAAAGFPGLLILGEDHALHEANLSAIREMGFDAVYSYHWPTFAAACRPSTWEDQAAIVEAQERCWDEQARLSGLPVLPTVSMGWDAEPWHGPGRAQWQLTPGSFGDLCRRAVEYSRGADPSPVQRLVLVDNWNEFGEGHYVFPHREHGFAYLDAVRAAFCPDAGPHRDLVPEDLGLGPYDSLFSRADALEELMRSRDARGTPAATGLVAWWRFAPATAREGVVPDRSGDGHGCLLSDAAGPLLPWTRGRPEPWRQALEWSRRDDRDALELRGGCGIVQADPRLSPRSRISVTAQILLTERRAGEQWLVNAVQGAGDVGYRLGLAGDRVAWGVPLEPWGQTLQSEIPVPLNRWVSLVATFDGREQVVYLDGEAVGRCARQGPIRRSTRGLCLGSHAPGHPLAFHGLVHEIRIYDRVLDDRDIRELTEP